MDRREYLAAVGTTLVLSGCGGGGERTSDENEQESTKTAESPATPGNQATAAEESPSTTQQTNEKSTESPTGTDDYDSIAEIAHRQPDADGNWTQRGYDAQRTRFNPGTRVPDAPEQVWQRELGTSDYQPRCLVVGDTLVTDIAGVTAYGLDDGEERYAIDGIDPRVVSDGSAIYTEHEHEMNDYHFAAFDPESGEELWSVEDGEVRGDHGPLIYDGRLYSYGSGIVCTDLESQTVEWRADPDYGQAGAMVAGDGQLYAVTGMGDYIAAFDPGNGERTGRWEVESTTRQPRLWEDIIYVHDVALGPSREPEEMPGQALAACPGGLLYLRGATYRSGIGFMTADGTEAWTFDPDAEVHAAAFADGAVLLATDDRVVGLGAATGIERWAVDLEASPRDVIPTQDKIVVSQRFGYVTVLA